MYVLPIDEIKKLVVAGDRTLMLSSKTSQRTFLGMLNRFPVNKRGTLHESVPSIVVFVVMCFFSCSSLN